MPTSELVKNGRVDVLPPLSSNHSTFSQNLKIYIEKNGEKTKRMNNLGP
jgi:hypothetical protein